MSSSIKIYMHGNIKLGQCLGSRISISWDVKMCKHYSKGCVCACVCVCVCVCVRERERERERERQTDRQTDRQTNRQTDRQTDRDRGLYFLPAQRCRGENLTSLLMDGPTREHGLLDFQT